MTWKAKSVQVFSPSKNQTLWLKVCLSVKLPAKVFGWKNKIRHTFGPARHKFWHPALNQNMAPCSPTGVTVHAAVCSVCDPQSGRLNALLSERTDGQVYAHLPGTQHYASVVPCLMLKCPSSQMHEERGRNNCEYVFIVQFSVSHQSSVYACRWRMVCVCVARPLTPAPSQRRRPWSSTWMQTVTQSDISWRWVGLLLSLNYHFIAQVNH